MPRSAKLSISSATLTRPNEKQVELCRANRNLTQSLKRSQQDSGQTAGQTWNKQYSYYSRLPQTVPSVMSPRGSTRGHYSHNTQETKGVSSLPPISTQKAKQPNSRKGTSQGRQHQWESDQENESQTGCCNILPKRKQATGRESDYNQYDQHRQRVTNIQGLPNVGNTCYANSIFQVLGQTECLTSKLYAQGPKKEFLITTMLFDLIQYLNGLHVVRINIDNLLRTLLQRVFQRDRSFSLGRQNDSHSFLLSLFESIRSEEELEGSNESVLDLFEGTMHNGFDCDQEHHDPAETQLFTSLLVPMIKNGNTGYCDVSDGLDILFEKERFSTEVLPCRECIRKRTTSKYVDKRLVIDKAPEILVLQLGTFREVRNRFGRTILYKDNSAVRYQNKLDGSYLKSSYELYGVVSHSGSLQGGHYIAYVRSASDQRTWFCCSDRTVRKTENPVYLQDSGAFLLFYEKKKRETIV